MKSIVKFVTFLLFICTVAYGQTRQSLDDTRGFFLDALCFRGQTDSLHRVDVFTVMPYQTLQFIKQGDRYLAQYSATVTVRDSAGKKVTDFSQERSVAEIKYDVTVGATGQFDYFQKIFWLPPGTYTIDVVILDAMSKQEYSRSRKITVIDYRRYDFAMSNILLASSVAQIGSRFTITPHITDNVSPLLPDGFFAVFETYNSALPSQDSADFVYQLFDQYNTQVARGNRIRAFVGAGKNLNKEQHFIKIVPSLSLPPGTYTLRISALRPDTSTALKSEDTWAIAERSLRLEWKNAQAQLSEEELVKSIRQLRYVALQSDIDRIEAGKTSAEKQQLFNDFWKQLDPTPTTLRNEAFEEYYARVEYANKTFRSYSEGWLTQMGMVYIIFGRPNSVDRQPNRSDGRSVEVWTYNIGRQFVFIDTSGFGDFRLNTPLSSSDKYRYGR